MSTVLQFNFVLHFLLKVSSKVSNNSSEFLINWLFKWSWKSYDSEIPIHAPATRRLAQNFPTFLSGELKPEKLLIPRVLFLDSGSTEFTFRGLIKIKALISLAAHFLSWGRVLDRDFWPSSGVAWALSFLSPHLSASSTRDSNRLSKTNERFPPSPGVAQPDNLRSSSLISAVHEKSADGEVEMRENKQSFADNYECGKSIRCSLPKLFCFTFFISTKESQWTTMKIVSLTILLLRLNVQSEKWRFYFGELQ